MNDTLLESDIPDLECVHRGKVRDLYRVDDDHWLMVTTDRLSAFDVILPTPVPDKGRVLTAITVYWMRRIERELGIPNQLTDIPLAEVVPDPGVRAPLEGRSLVVRRLEALPVEAVVRGYLIGSGWKDYQATGAVCGLPLPPGLELAGALPEPLFTPSTKAAVGDHDENVDFDHVAAAIGEERAREVRDASIAIYNLAREHAAARGIIIADTKFEFGLDREGRLHLIDEVLTPDSSRFWPADEYTPGRSPASFDKQYVRDYLETLDWDKTAPGPALPAEIAEQTAARYREALERLTGSPLDRP
ncbi:phosphoribosylaminoimidazolesuccinocarboxamide synthase [Thioalkalivibrio halophilus]|uniref:Phosphoribosylaminoimidazole-succinocarboxamide synthase n=1 Tax=Thioalkalivibrio halophilus TaxID=252474 RepID=A0A1V2ZVV2_9GAMM|nr:phosphoribosylaminoimidazolesuccinocarboxamide synthase [Thioalkalivibrio halophilus]OOC09260.1 phosphoribosylaminoimidazolesuccinocarboxamide synthase [Thioalkalivibrio halophilus]